MPNRLIPYVKVLVHLVCLLPVIGLVRMYLSGALGLLADPVNYITHQTGYWALFLLLASLAVTPVRRLHPKLANLIRFRRLLGLYAFFYASLHLATYVFLFSGYDVPTAWAGLRAGHPGALAEQWKLVWPTMVDDLKKRRFIQVGLFAWFLLFVLAVTSPAFIMRWMGGKRWRQVHWLVYVAACAGAVHYWWLVKKGVRAPMRFTLALIALLLARVVWTVMKRKRGAVAAPRSSVVASG
jgi:sulfoxide reductase heme-binding subunit YedZ